VWLATVILPTACQQAQSLRHQGGSTLSDSLLGVPKIHGASTLVWDNIEWDSSTDRAVVAWLQGATDKLPPGVCLYDYSNTKETLVYGISDLARYTEAPALGVRTLRTSESRATWHSGGQAIGHLYHGLSRMGYPGDALGVWYKTGCPEDAHAADIRQAGDARGTVFVRGHHEVARLQRGHLVLPHHDGADAVVLGGSTVRTT